MKSDVILSIKGLHIHEMMTSDEGIEVITPAKYYQKNEKHYILYDEVIPETKEIIGNRLKIEQNRIEFIKGGAKSSKLVFERDRINISQYQTPYGAIMVGTTTKQMDVKEEPDGIDVSILYALDINDQWASDCNVNIKVRNMHQE